MNSVLHSDKIWARWIILDVIINWNAWLVFTFQLTDFYFFWKISCHLTWGKNDVFGYFINDILLREFACLLTGSDGASDDFLQKSPIFLQSMGGNGTKATFSCKRIVNRQGQDGCDTDPRGKTPVPLSSRA